MVGEGGGGLAGVLAMVALWRGRGVVGVAGIDDACCAGLVHGLVVIGVGGFAEFALVAMRSVVFECQGCD